jgi:putative membrane protein
MYWDHMSGWGWTMMIFWSAIWIGLVAVLAWIAVQWARRSPQDAPEPRTARELLDERLATGEIDPDEYQRRRGALEQRTPAGV